MLPRVMLHVIVAPLPVDDALNLAAGLKGFVQLVVNLAAPLPHIAHRYPIQGAGIRGLPSALRVKSRGV